jgi:hypothetical protein
VLGFINQLSLKLNNDMKLPALQVGQAGSSGAQPAGQPAAAATQPATAAPTQVASSSATATPAASRTEARPASATAAPAKKQQKMDIRTAMLYSKALEEEDAGNRTKAVELYRQVVTKFPEYAPAQAKIAKLSRG